MSNEAEQHCNPFDVKVLRQLVKLMREHELTDLEIVSGEQKIRLAKSTPTVPSTAAPPLSVPQQAAPTEANRPAAPQPTTESTEDLAEVKSPMVGTFYAAPSPDTAPYVTTGSRVSPDTVVCIIEAMKVFNEIQAETAGQVAQILVKNGEAVEFGQPLFLVKP